MTLRQKTLLIIGVTLVILIGLIYTTGATILLRDFSQFEQRETHEHIKRVQSALSDEIDSLNQLNRNWAGWGETYEFIEKSNNRYIKNHLNNVNFSIFNLHLIIYIQSSGKIVFASSERGDRKSILIHHKLKQDFSSQNFWTHFNRNTSLKGIIFLAQKPILIASSPILKNDGSGKNLGTLIMGRYLDAAAIKRLGERTHLSITMYAVNDEKTAAELGTVRSALLRGKSTLVRPLNKQTIAGYTLLKDIYGKPALILRVAIPRNIYQQGGASIRYLILSVLIVGLVFGVVTLLLLEKLFLSRLLHLTNHLHSISNSRDFSAQLLPNTGKDELFQLADTINIILAALINSQNQQKEREERYYKYSRVLAQLTKSQTWDSSDLNAGFREIIETAACTLEVERVSVWLYDGQKSKMQCVDLYQRSTGQHSAGMELLVADYPAYFQALEQERTLATENVSIDPITKEMSERYLYQFDIKSMLSASICLNGKIVGMLCHSHVGSNRQWLLEEQNFVGSLAGLVALLMEASERKRSQVALQKAYEELETRIRERTGDLAKANEQLQAQIIERHIAEEKLLYEAFHDALTGLPNRALFMQRLESAHEKAKQADYLLAVLFLDLDRFKIVNDSLGHLVGDQLLIAIARRLQTCLRPGDLVARLGGDEFTILLENIKDFSDATKVAERIQQELTKPFYLNGHEVFTAASIGIALNDTVGDRPEDLLRDADVTMYRAKSLGKARYEVFDSSMHTQAMTRLQLENDLQRAIKREEFRIEYQPIVSLNNGMIYGFEALVRWQHPLRGRVAPTEFIPVVEETGLIVPIGWWVLRKACIQTRKWQQNLVTTVPLTISVNFSAKQFSQPNLVEQIEQILQETGLEANCLQLEITESVIIDNPTAVAAILLQLKKLGVRLYIDDFGTGYSSLSYLHRFPVNGLKIDYTFVSNIGVENENTELVRTIATMAHNLKLNVVAEGIETSEQLAQLRALQCEYGQGYFFSPPLHPKAAAALITKLEHTSF